jgi:PAS domain S-box-containing protein
VSPEQFLEWARVFPEPLCLVSGEGQVLACNAPAAALLGLPNAALSGILLTALATDPAEMVKRYLRLCSSSRDMQLGSLTLRAQTGEIHNFRCEGAVLQPRSGDQPSLILLRLQRKASASSQFLLLNEKIEALAKEVRIRRQAEEEAQAQRERLSVTLASIGDGVIVTDEQGAITFANAVAQSLTGWGADEVIGQPLDKVFRIIHEFTRQEVESPLGRVLREGVRVELANHTALIAKDGTERSIADCGAPIRDQSGQIVGAVLVFHDCTASREAAAVALRLAAIVESSEDAIVSKTLAGVVTSWNRAAERIFGYSAAEAVGQPIQLIIPPERRAEEDWILTRLRLGERIETYETVRRHKNGTLLDVSLTISPIKDNEGHIIGASKIARDITKQKLQKQALRESEIRFRTLADNIPQLAWMARPDGHIFWYNQRWYEYTGMTPDSQEGWGWQSVHDPNVLPQVLERWQRSLATGEPFDMVFPLRGADGAYRPFLTRVSPVQDEQGQVTRWFGTNTDISEQLAAEEALRTADRRKNEFLAMLAHELRNPLAPIRNAAQVLKLAGSTDARQQWAREVIERQIQHLTRLVDDLLDVSRITRGKVAIQREPLELSTILNRALETSRPLIDARRHHLTLSYPAERLWVEGDLTRLVQVVGNLLNNAAKYTDEGGHLWLEATREGGEAEVRVRDNGMGLSADLLPHVFDLFTQAERSLDRSQGGLGIGLTLVRTLVELHGGRVEARSEGPGRGSEFIIRLPVFTPKMPAGADGASNARGVKAIPARRILVVEDNQDSAEMMRLMLELDGHEVRTAYDGRVALEAARAFEPQLVLCDIGLPGMSGYEVAKQLRAQPAFKNTPLVALSGYGQEEDIRRAQEAGFTHHLTKPVEPEVLGALLSSL